MMNQKRKVFGTVLRLRCTNCASTFPHFIFSGDEDTDTLGLCSVSSCENNEVVIGEMEPDEWSDFENSGALCFQQRVSQQLGRHDLRAVRLLRVEHRQESARGLSFRDYSKSYKSPVLVFSCPCCPDGESKSYEEITAENFQLSGGKISTVGALSVLPT